MYKWNIFAQTAVKILFHMMQLRKLYPKTYISVFSTVRFYGIKFYEFFSGICRWYRYLYSDAVKKNLIRSVAVFPQFIPRPVRTEPVPEVREMRCPGS